MFSYENLFACTGDNKWAERLELIAFNALPAAISDDMWTHQYVQMSNQIACERFPGKSLFRTNNHEAHMFGLEPQFGCCTCNFNQGWPKFALSAFMHNNDTVLSVIPVPSELKNNGREIKLETNYPFENSLKYTVKSENDFTFKVRVPSFAKNLTVNGDSAENSGELTFDIKAGETRIIEIAFECTPYFMDRPHGLKSVHCGSLVFSVPIKFEKKMYEYESNGVERKFPYCDYELIPLEDWNYAYSSDALSVNRNEIADIPFDSSKPPVTVSAEVTKIDWGYEDGYEKVCAKVPQSLKELSEAKTIELYPYACAKLRMTEMPKIS